MVELLTEKKRRETKHKRQQEKQKKEAQKEAQKEAKKQVDLNSNTPRPLTSSPQNKGNPTDPALTGGHLGGRVNAAFRDDDRAPDRVSNPCPVDDEERDLKSAERRVTHSIILDLSTTSFLDTVTANTLSN
ncbi:hypothetical protein NHX12_012475, partial [Muraenolepis orangiensis]